jgi:2-keto-4-pentenoate hydratase/2-oxohepta-3-ene-1,7-dioic acid hydratase in catechol pathway
MRIVRFEDDKGHVRLGTPADHGTAEELVESDGGGYTPTGRIHLISLYLPPVSPPAVICIGLNYGKHARETGAELPDRPVVFMKNPAAVVGHGADIVLPASCREPLQVDYEVELAVIIGKSAKNVAEDEALSFVRGYTVANDVSARIWQKRGGGGQWIRGKSFDTFCPLGPWMVTADEIEDPNGLDLALTLNGEVMQKSSTADMIFSVKKLVSYLSEDTTLLPGTVILTGTPEGVGFARKPPVYLKPGDRLSLSVSGIGTLENRVV